MKHERSRDERRLRRRFPLSYELRYRTLENEDREPGQGKTINISSRGLLFTIDRVLSPGMKVEIHVDWPFKLDDRVALKLVLFGRVVRVQGKEHLQAAMRIERHEFRTVSQAP